MGQLHVYFFPFMAHGHMIPVLDMAKLFASRGVKSTIVTTPLNAPVFTNPIQRAKNLDIGLQIIQFPAAEMGLPPDCESADKFASLSLDTIAKFFEATTLLQDSLESLLEEERPNCLIADMLFPWSNDAAAKFNIPRLVFHGISYFSLCAMESMRLYKPQNNVESDTEPFVIPCLPHEVKLTKMQIPERERTGEETVMTKVMIQVKESELASYGVIVNSFLELEPDYADHYTKVLGRKAWHVGPVSLCNRRIQDKLDRGKKASIDEDECLKWLDSKEANSVLYVCFGSLSNFAASQLYEIAIGLEASEQQFIWVVRNGKGKTEEEEEEWLPEGFEERVNDRGIIIRGWAPQVLILDHEATGGFVTHCGWNSILEGVCGGVPMVTWPVMAEQFYNEKLVTEILRVGVSSGSNKWNRLASGVTRDMVEKAVRRVMVGEEAEEMRKRSKALNEMAKEAVEEGGSSYSSLDALIEELSSY